MQLQLLDLMIPKECGAAPMDAATRADLIDLMARVSGSGLSRGGEKRQ
jgi:alkylation response protein AidB-like acyl-CoA dehydrogenase